MSTQNKYDRNRFVKDAWWFTNYKSDLLQFDLYIREDIFNHKVFFYLVHVNKIVIFHI